MAWDAQAARLVLGLMDSAGPSGNSVATLDPATLLSG